MSLNLYNNFGVGAVAIAAVLNECNTLPISKVALIFPFINHQELLNYLSKKTTKIKSFDKLVIEKTSFFSNFNKRYYDSLSSTINALQYLNDQGYIEFKDHEVHMIKLMDYSKEMGTRTSKIFLASKNINLILDELVEKLYLNLRIEL